MPEEGELVNRRANERRTKFARRLCEVRSAKGLTQFELAERTGIDFTYISRLENGRVVPSLALIERLAKGLELEIYQFFLDVSAEAEAPKLLPHGVQEWSLLRVFRQMSSEDRSLLFFLAEQLASRASSSTQPWKNG